MKKYGYFQSSAQLSQLECRLQKNGYLSKGSLPNSADAKVFLLFERLRKIPKRTTHPNLYHWYILMKQFSLRTVQIWQQQATPSDDDHFINQYVSREMLSAEKENTLATSNTNPHTHQNHLYGSETSSGLLHGKTASLLSTPKNTCKTIKNQQSNEMLLNRGSMAPVSLKMLPTESWVSWSKSDVSSPAFEIEYVMEMQLKQSSRRISGLKQRLEQQKLELISWELEDGSIRVVFKADADECEKLKDRISKWEEISNLRFRKEKRFNAKSEHKIERVNEHKTEKIIVAHELALTNTN